MSIVQTAPDGYVRSGSLWVPNSFGFVRVGAGVPLKRVANCAYNVDQALEVVAQAHKQQVNLLGLDEHTIASYSCGEFFNQDLLRVNQVSELERFCRESRFFDGLIFVGMQLVVDGMSFNCSVAVHRGSPIGVQPKMMIPNYGEFNENRWFISGHNRRRDWIVLFGRKIPFTPWLLYHADDVPGLIVSSEVCEDLFGVVSPSNIHAIHGATVQFNLSASSELIGKKSFRRSLVSVQAAKTYGAYIYTSSSYTNSTTDCVMGGHALITELGSILAEAPLFQRQNYLIVHDVDVDHITHDRQATNSFGEGPTALGLVRPDYQHVRFTAAPKPRRLVRKVEAHPFNPKDVAVRNERCSSAFEMMVAALDKRLEAAGPRKVSIGVSGGRNSTMALLVAWDAMRKRNRPATDIIAVTMPGFGTTDGTKQDAMDLMKALGVTVLVRDIRKACFADMKAMGHKPFGIDIRRMSLKRFEQLLKELPKEKAKDLVFENVQARMRTLILMQYGFVIGTGDLSEAAVGWCTFNADQQNMYNAGKSFPKSLVEGVLAWAADCLVEGVASTSIRSVLSKEVSPELLPVGADGKISQKTDDSVGPLELRDFFLYHNVRWGTSPAKLLYLALHATFNYSYSVEDLEKWMKVYFHRFITQHYKHNDSPDGPKIGTIALGPRAWMAPSDGDPTAWLESVNHLLAVAAMEPSTDGGEAVPAEDAARFAANLKEIVMTATKNPDLKINQETDVSLGVDPQVGFIAPGGNLGVEGAGAIVEPGNRVMALLRDKAFTQDAHPDDHVSFWENHPGRKQYDQIEHKGVKVTLFNKHCVDGTPDADFAPGLNREGVVVFKKGTNRDYESFSGFRDAGGNVASELPAWLKEKRKKRIFMWGLVTNICVRANALDAAADGYEVYIVLEACYGLETHPGAVQAAIDELKATPNIHIISIDELEAANKPE